MTALTPPTAAKVLSRPRSKIDATLRVDRYSEFGASWSPSFGIGWSPTDLLRLRASAGRAFRVPTFTERYYSDPANLARYRTDAYVV